MTDIDRRKEQRVLGMKDASSLLKEVLAKNMIIAELEGEIAKLKLENQRLKDMLHNMVSKRLAEMK